jgi:2-desacetyl-2-hydroxyethyl bacteriochlorophyllide A dehydrogenase
MGIVTRAAVLKGPYDIELVEETLHCKDDEVIVKNHLVGICGTDKNFYRGVLPEKTSEFRHEPTFPFPLGHESGGVVVEVGSKVSDYQVGDRVISFGWNNNYADYFAAKAWQLQPAPEGMDMDLVSLGEPIACAMFSGMNSGVQLGDTVVIMGAGFAGQVIAQCAKQKGAHTVIVVDVLDQKLEIAKQLGADVVVNLQDNDLREIVAKLTDGIGADVVIEAAGTEESFNLCSEIVKHNGKFVFYSWVTQPITLNISRWHDDGLEFINTCLVHHTWHERYAWTPSTLRPVMQGMVDINTLISKEFSLDNLAEAFAYADQDDAAIKVVIRP